MKVKRCCLAAAIAGTMFAATSSEAGLFDRLRERNNDRFESKANEPQSLGFEVASKEEIGKVVTPVSYQALPAPGNEQLVPVPEGQPIPATGRVQSFYQSPTAPAYPAVPMESYPPAPSYPQGFAYPPGMEYPVHPGMPIEGAPLFTRVKIDDPEKMHPCAVPMVVQVLDPFAPRHPCHSCGPQCVYVQIMVPPGQVPRIKLDRGGRKVKYKFADSQIEVETKDGYIEVDYDD